MKANPAKCGEAWSAKECLCRKVLGERPQGHGDRRPYPSIVELRLDADIVAFLLVLCAEHLQLSRLQRTGLISTNQFLEFREDGDRQRRTTDLSASAASVWRQQVSQDGQVTEGSIDNAHGRLDMVER
jgi:hypothetical protein